MKWSDKITIQIGQINNALESAGFNPETISIEDKGRIALDAIEWIKHNIDVEIEYAVQSYKSDKEWDDQDAS